MSALFKSNAPPTSTFTFSSQPKAIAPQRTKYRNPEEEERNKLANIMYDPRVVRGNTYRLQTIPSSAQPDPLDLQKQQEAQRKAEARARVKDKLRPRTPEAVDGRKHIDVQTELYLEELSDRVAEADAEAQTDAFLDRPPSPLFVPPKTGIDVHTQILPGELFDFDVEVQGILEVIVGKTLEQSLMEVMEEEELDTLRDHQTEFEELRMAELIATQQMEEQARRRQDEKNRRIKQQLAVAQAEKETAEKIAARAFARNYMNQLLPSVFGHLHDNGVFFDVQEREIESQFIPWLMESTEKRINLMELSRKILDAILLELVHQRQPIEPPSIAVEESAAIDVIVDTPDAPSAPAPVSEQDPAESATAEPQAEDDSPPQPNEAGDDDNHSVTNNADDQQQAEQQNVD